MAMERTASKAPNGYFAAYLLLYVVSLTTFSYSAMAQCSPAESAALLKFKSAFLDPGGDLNTWGPAGDNCCGWKGVQCSRSGVGGLNLILEASVRGRTLTLDPNNPDAGTKAGAALAELTQLVTLHFDWVVWNAPLPLASLSTLPLREIIIRHGHFGNRNSLGGALQNDIAALAPTLEVLILSDTNYNIGLPSNLCKLTKLKVLEISASRIPNVGPACLGSLPSLQEVRMNSNPGVTGGLPVWPTALPNLKVLDFSNNAHSGNIPVQYSKLAGAQVFLAGNHLAGHVPPGLSGKPESAFRPGNPNLCGAPLEPCPV